HVARQTLDEIAAEVALVVAQHADPPERVEIRDRRAEAGEQLIRQRPRLEAAPHRCRRRRARLVRPPGLRKRLSDVRHAEMWPTELVGRADEHVAAELTNV